MSNQTKYLHCRVSGEGHPVIFLHGFLESMTMWNYLNFRLGFKHVYIDLPGHGRSTTKSETMVSILAMAKLVKATIDSLGVEEYHVVGHSMGGYVGLELIQLDARCKKLVMLNSNFWSDELKKQRDRRRVANIVASNKTLFLYEAIPNLFLNPIKNDQVVQDLIQEAGFIDAQCIADVSIAMSKRNDLSHLARELNKRILVIQGAEDAIVPVERMRGLQQKSEFVYKELQGCGHMAHIEKPNAVINVIEKFLK